MSTTTTTDWIEPGAVVVVVERERYGSRVVRATTSRAEEKVESAHRRWSKAVQYSASYRATERDEAQVDRAPALYALADAVVALRAVYIEQGIEEEDA